MCLHVLREIYKVNMFNCCMLASRNTRESCVTYCSLRVEQQCLWGSPIHKQERRKKKYLPWTEQRNHINISSSR